MVSDLKPINLSMSNKNAKRNLLDLVVNSEAVTIGGTRVTLREARRVTNSFFKYIADKKKIKIKFSYMLRVGRVAQSV